MNKICTDINQSKKLIELGIDISTADMWYHGHCSPWKSEREYDSDACPFHSMRPNWDIPAWSLSVLLKLIPKSTISTPNPFSENYCCRNIEFDMEFYADNPVDTAYEMIVWLKENNLKEK